MQGTMLQVAQGALHGSGGGGGGGGQGSRPGSTGTCSSDRWELQIKVGRNKINGSTKSDIS